MTRWFIVIYHRRTCTGRTGSLMGCEQRSQRKLCSAFLCANLGVLCVEKSSQSCAKLVAGQRRKGGEIWTAEAAGSRAPKGETHDDPRSSGASLQGCLLTSSQPAKIVATAHQPQRRDGCSANAVYPNLCALRASAVGEPHLLPQRHEERRETQAWKPLGLLRVSAVASGLRFGCDSGALRLCVFRGVSA